MEAAASAEVRVAWKVAGSDVDQASVPDTGRVRRVGWVRVDCREKGGTLLEQFLAVGYCKLALLSHAHLRKL